MMKEQAILQEGVRQVKDAWHNQQWEAIPSIVSGWASALNAQSMMTHVLSYSDAPTVNCDDLFAASPTRVEEATGAARRIEPLSIVLRPAISLTEEPDAARVEGILLALSVATDRLFCNVVRNGATRAISAAPRDTLAFVGSRVLASWCSDLQRVVREPSRHPESTILHDDEAIIADLDSGPLGSYYLAPVRIAVHHAIDASKYPAVSIVRNDDNGGPFVRNMPNRLEFSLVTEVSIVVAHKKQFTLLSGCPTEEADAQETR